MSRAVIYARYSTELQSDSSIEDQIRMWAPRKMRLRGPFWAREKQRMTAERRVGVDRRRFSVVFARSVAVQTHVFRHRLAHVGPRAAARPSSCTARRML